MEIDIKKVRTSSPKQKPDESNLGFCKYFTDHMFTLDYSPELGWHDPQIMPYAPIPLDPSTAVFHYAQEIFEGLKAYRSPKGDTLLFRPEENGKRLNLSHARMCIPELPVEDFVRYVREIVAFDNDWVPSSPETSLYIRPFTIATDTVLGVHASHTYKFIIILSPVGAYYAGGFNPIKIFVQDDYVRAVQGGTGDVKCGGNYAGSMKGQVLAQSLGYSQVLWLDGNERKYVEEVGAMNIMFKIGDEIVTAPIAGSILPGITRKSCIDILRSWGMKVTERRISIDELIAAAESGELKEAFGTGTAAVVTPVGLIGYHDKDHTIGGFKVGETTQKLYDTLTGIQWGKLPDTHNWVQKI